MRVGIASFSILSLFTLVAACGTHGRIDGNGGTDGNPGSGGDGGGSCTSSTPDSCSADGHSVVDCSGNVVTTCADDQTCLDAACMSACDVAAAEKSSIGCEYYAVAPDAIGEAAGGCFAAYIANTSTSPVTLTVDFGGQNLPIDGFARVPSGTGQSLTYAPLSGGVLAPNQVAILFLSRFGDVLTDCPSGVTPGYTSADAAEHGTGYGTAFHIKSSAPVVAYDIYPYGGGAAAATSATLLLPTSVWDVNYVAVDAFAKSQVVADAQPFIEIVGSAPSTTVTIRPTAAIEAGTGVSATAVGSIGTYTVAAGQVLQFTQDAELNGSTITADQPIGVWGGATCLSIDVNTEACDSAHQNIAPVKALGNRYVAVRYRNRFAGQEETVPWRIVGAVDGTTLTYTPSAPPNAPTLLGQGDVAQFDSPGQFEVQSQGSDHPFYMSAHMTGCETVDPDEEDCRGDPEFINIIPPEQYLPSYTFFTDPTYPETNIVLVRENKGTGFADVTVDCVGTVTGWTPIDAADTIEYTRLDFVTGDFMPVGNCNNGLHTASSAEPFGLVVWGWGTAATGGEPGDSNYSQAVSYAYPAGASVKPINSVVIE